MSAANDIVVIQSSGRRRITSEPATFTVRPVGVVRSVLTDRAEAPRQGREGAPDAWLEVDPAVAEALDGVTAGDEVLVLTAWRPPRREASASIRWRLSTALL
ncbi:hypothetical protein ACQP2K_23785 [Microbispora siamensis]